MMYFKNKACLTNNIMQNCILETLTRIFQSVNSLMPHSLKSDHRMPFSPAHQKVMLALRFVVSQLIKLFVFAFGKGFKKRSLSKD